MIKEIKTLADLTDQLLKLDDYKKIKFYKGKRFLKTPISKEDIISMDIPKLKELINTGLTLYKRR